MTGQAKGGLRLIRDRFGIPHVDAADERSAWWGLGYACAQDRAFQLDYDRRRACGRLAEVLGPAALDGDVLTRKFDLARSAKEDLEAMSPASRSSFEAYADGVNAAWERLKRPPEIWWDLEPWQPWHSVAIFKVRHVFMGTWQYKLARAVLLARSDPAVMARLEVRPPLGSPVTLPPGERLAALLEHAAADVENVAPYLGFLSEVEAGSNAWAVAPAKSAGGSAVLCNDSHRALDVPNVYWQAHVRCPRFEVAGATFPGLPGFSHFGHNGRVAWAITHAGADTQDLFIEHFDGVRVDHGRRGEAPEPRVETVRVAGGEAKQIEVWRTANGPIVHGDPRTGLALSLRWTATDRPSRGLDVLQPMLTADSVESLLASQEGWVDPVNNLVAADVDGHIGYLLRGELPIRRANGGSGLPVPGWLDAGEWTGRAAFSDMPTSIDPHSGFLFTANHPVREGSDPFVASSFGDPWRAERLLELVSRPGRLSTAELAAMQADVTSKPAQAWGQLLETLGPLGNAAEPAELARQTLAGWNGAIGADSGAALVYGCFRRALASQLYRPLLGERTWSWVASGVLPPTPLLVRQWLANDVWDLLGGYRPPGFSAASADDRSQHVRDVLPAALANAWRAASEAGRASWSWGAHHRAVGRHPLSAVTGGEGLDLPVVCMGGDSDTVQAASYGWVEGTPFFVLTLSVYRQVVDLADPGAAEWVIPGGASGRPDSPHFADQLPLWAAHQRAPMLWDWTEVERRAEEADHLSVVKSAAVGGSRSRRAACDWCQEGARNVGEGKELRCG
jgi:penicillin G amidase